MVEPILIICGITIGLFLILKCLVNSSIICCCPRVNTVEELPGYIEQISDNTQSVDTDTQSVDIDKNVVEKDDSYDEDDDLPGYNEVVKS